MSLSLIISFLIALATAQNVPTSYTGGSHCSGTQTTPAALTNTSFFDLPHLFANARQPQDASAIEQIKNTLALYPLCIDGKSFDDLSLVFTDDAVANYSVPLNIVTPLSAIKTVLAASLAPVTTQHQFGTQVVELFGPCAARSVTYYRADHFGRGKYEGQILTAWGQYRDVLVRTPAGWKVKQRTLAYMAPLIGNLSIFA